MPRHRDVYELADEVGGMYALVVAAAKRAKQLREGRQPVVQGGSSNPITTALQELVEGRVVVRPPGAAEEEPTAQTEVVEVTAPGRQDERAAPAAAGDGAEDTVEAGAAEDVDGEETDGGE